MIRILLLSALLLGGWQLGGGVYIYAKARLAQQLLESAWQQTLENYRGSAAIQNPGAGSALNTRPADTSQSEIGSAANLVPDPLANQKTPPVRPWPWADTWPMARLQVAELGISQIVLSGDSGRTLAFGPGHNEASARPGEPGITIISGHRDTHFSFLQQLKSGSRLQLQTEDRELSYRVRQTQIVDSRLGGILDSSAGHALLLVTCYPFDDISVGGPLRYLVWAEPTSETTEGRPATAAAPQTDSVVIL